MRREMIEKFNQEIEDKKENKIKIIFDKKEKNR